MRRGMFATLVNSARLQKRYVKIAQVDCNYAEKVPDIPFM
jgi:hypothetical protein